MAQSDRLSAAGVAGPLFISVGRPDQLATFQQLNPELKDAPALIDDSPSYEAYRAAGFNYLMGDKALQTPPDFKPPKSMSGGKWWSYLRNVGDLSPIPKGLKFGELPNGVRVLGGTYAIDGEDVVFAHMDEVPGATPEIEKVLASIGA